MYRRYYQEDQEKTKRNCCPYCLVVFGIIGFFFLIGCIAQKGKNSMPTIYVEELTWDQKITLAFEDFKSVYGKKYATIDEENLRRSIFRENYEMIDKINKEDHSYKLGINKFADLTQDEFKKYYLTQPEPVDIPESQTPFSDPPDPYIIDWVNENVLNSVRDQGNCGSCWTFASVAAAEAVYAINHKKERKQFSEQQLIDCYHSSSSDGCNGGERWEALQYITKDGLVERSSYPYKARNNQCKTDKLHHERMLYGYKNITSGNSTELAEELLKRPVTVGVNASPIQFMFYERGILDQGCPSNQINHAVLAVGMGTENNKKFWKIRNSWGSGWGEGGYIRILREMKPGPGLCAVAAKACAPLYKPSK